MNKRIRELYQQAYNSVHEFQAGMLVLSPVEEKFAQLIATDCADLARDVGTNTDPEDWALDRCYEIEQRIRDRYGVEE
jgi:hypothetical protein